MSYSSILTFISSLFFSLTYLGCNAPVQKQQTENLPRSEKKEDGEFFDYDEIDYYTSEVQESEINVLYDKRDKSKLDSIKFGVILDEIPHDLVDLSFVAKLDKMGFSREKIEPTKFQEINKVFMEKTSSEHLVTSCIPIFRDILIFKRNGKILGTAKLCFDCNKNQINGSKGNTENFGQDGDYARLETLLKK